MSLTKYKISEQKKIEEFKKGLLHQSLIPCEIKVGDFVTFTNEFGVFFRQPIKVIGFDDGCEPERFIYTDSEVWWFPSRASELKLVEKTSTGCLLVRELTMQSMNGFEYDLIEDDSNWYRLVSESSLHTVWVNDAANELVTFCEGDLIWQTALDDHMYRAEINRTFAYFQQMSLMDVSNV